jgi:hypothetical protein
MEICAPKDPFCVLVKLRSDFLGVALVVEISTVASFVAVAKVSVVHAGGTPVVFVAGLAGNSPVGIIFFEPLWFKTGKILLALVV